MSLLITGKKTITQALSFIKRRLKQVVDKTSATSSMSKCYFRIYNQLSEINKPGVLFDSISLLDSEQPIPNLIIIDIVQFLNDEINAIKTPAHIIKFANEYNKPKSKAKSRRKSHAYKQKQQLNLGEQALIQWKDKKVKLFCFIFFFFLVFFLTFIVFNARI